MSKGVKVVPVPKSLVKSGSAPVISNYKYFKLIKQTRKIVLYIKRKNNSHLTVVFSYIFIKYISKYKYLELRMCLTYILN